MTKANKGFTLVEVMITMVVLIGLLVGLLSLSIYSFDLQETGRNITVASNRARTKLEEIRDYPNSSDTAKFEDILSFNGQKTTLTLAADGLEGLMQVDIPGGTYVTGSSNSLIDVNVVVCWKQKGGRIVGTASIDPTSGAFTDCTGSPVQLATSISKKK